MPYKKAKTPFHEVIATIQTDFGQIVGDRPDKMIWEEEDKKQFYDELSGDEG